MAAGAVHLAAGGFALAEEQGIWHPDPTIHYIPAVYLIPLYRKNQTRRFAH